MDSFFNLTPTLNQMLWFWGIAIVFFAMVEIITPALVTIWFVVGGLAALIAALCGASLVLQLYIFLGVTALLLIFCRPIVKDLLKVKSVATNASALIGQKGVVIEAINNIRSKGYVKISGLEFRARSANDEEIPADSIVQVERIEGNTLYVTKV